MTTLIVTLTPPGQPDPDMAYCQVSNAQTISSYGSASLGLLPRADDVVLLLPSIAVSWHRVGLPKLARSLSAPKLRAMLEALAEEVVLDDTAGLHIALYRPKAGLDPQAAWLAVCDKAWLAGQLQFFQGAGYKVSRIVPQAYPLPTVAASADVAGSGASPAARLHASGSPDMAMVTMTDSEGVLTVPLAQAKLLWPQLRTDDTFAVSAEPAVAAATEAALNIKVTVVQTAQVALQAMLDARNDGVDLAQGSMALTGSDRWLQKVGATLRLWLAAPEWRTARVGALVLALVHLVGLNAWAWKERSSLAAKRSQTTQILTQAFPQVKVVVDAPVQMQREMNALRQASGSLAGRDFESLYARFFALTTGLAAPAAIEFSAGEVSLKGHGMSTSQLAELAPKLRIAGLSARSEADKIIIAELTAQPPASTPAQPPASGAKP
jgi:general secretion pathway protein L